MCAVWNIKVSAFPRLSSSENGVENGHSDNGDREAKDTFPADHSHRMNSMLGHDEFL